MNVHNYTLTYGPFGRKSIFEVISGNLHVCAPNYAFSI